MAYFREGATIPTKGRRSKLTPKMRAFVDEYMLDPKMNASEAVRKAGYKCKPENANRIAVELLRHPTIRKEIEERKAARRERMELTEDYVLGKLVKIVEDTEDGNPQAALRGLELLGKHLGLYKDRQEISGPDGEAIQMEQKVKQDVESFKSRLARLATSGGAGDVVEFPKRQGEGGA